MSKIECPSEAWDRYCDAEERCGCPSEDEMLNALDAYGELWCGIAQDEENGEWSAWFDFDVYLTPDTGVLVAYEVVVDGGSFVDTLERGIVPADKAPFNLPDAWASNVYDMVWWTETEMAENLKANTEWNRRLREEIDKAEAQEAAGNED